MKTFSVTKRKNFSSTVIIFQLQLLACVSEQLSSFSFWLLVRSRYPSTVPFFLSTSAAFLLAKSNSFCSFSASWKSFSSWSVLFSMSCEMVRLQISLDVELDETIKSCLSISVFLQWINALGLSLFFAEPVNKGMPKLTTIFSGFLLQSQVHYHQLFLVVILPCYE